jgi:glucokinase
MKYYLGVDVGATTVKLGLMNEKKEIIGSRYDYPSRAGEGPEATMSVVKTELAHILEKHSLDPNNLAAAGICCPTPVSPEGEIIYPPNIDISWKGVNVKDLLSETLSVPAILLNDGDAAAYREYSVREAHGKASAAMVQFITGTGLGGAVILNGRILEGVQPGVAAELGHILTDSSADADVCGCGATGCAETRASLVGLKNLVSLRQKKGSVPKELEGEPMDVAKRLRKLAQTSNPLEDVMAIWAEYFMHLGRAMRNVANTIGCNLLVVSGGAQEQEKTASDAEYQAFLDFGIREIRKELTGSFPHLASIPVEWSMDSIPDSACYGTADYAMTSLTLK